MRKLLSVLSSTLQGGLRGGLLILTLLATSPLWASYSFKLGNLYYYIKNANEVTVTDANDARSITIPRTVTYDSITYIVTRIGDAAFYDCSSLTSISIPNSITSIGEGAFYFCSSLTSINIPNSVTSIGYAAFCGCSSLTSIALPEGVTSVENRTFQVCSSLTSITLPNSVTSIGHNAFDDCSNLISITIPNNVTSIGSAVFQGCSSLTSITIPNSVTSIGSHAFNLCSSLTSITIPEGVASIGERTFYDCSSLASITIPNSITSIGSNAFYNCSSLTSITLPNSVTSIGDYAFYNCSSLTSITIPEGVTSIGYAAFSGCSSLTSIALHEGVTSIGDYAFCDCSSLTSITIPNSVTSIGHNAFDDCSNLTSITIPNNVTSIESAVFQDCSSLTSVTIPNSVTSIGKSAFNKCSSLTSITIPEGVTSIGDYAFSYCSSLTSINIPDSVTSIGNYAFRCCSSLTSINIPNSITSIGEGTFYGCSSLTSATIGNSVTSIGAEAFYCVNLEEIYCYPTTPPAVTSEPTFLYYNATLYVPCDSKEAYEEHPVFGKFKNIKGIDDCGGGFVTTHIHETICQGEVYEFGEYLCDTTGTYTAIIGDVTTFLYLTVLPSSIDTITVEACDSYEWHGKVYTESGVYTYSDPYNPCVIEELHLTIIDTPTPPEPEIPTEGIGVFSIGKGKTVTFSRGNLQYTQSTDTWSFAANQYDYIGTDNVTGGSVSSDPKYGDSKEGTALADKVDLFGWSTSSTNFGVSTSDSNSDYSGSFVDWGTNQIGADAPNTWRTLTCNEWKYLLNNRPNANSLKGVAQVNGVNGLILLPDSWTCPSGVTFKSGFHSDDNVEAYGQYQTFTADQWSKLESAGAVFLPVAGYRYGSSVYNVLIYGDYWSATEDGSNYADCLYFLSDGAGMSFNSRYYGRSVRLVKDVNSTTPEPPVEPETEEIFIYQPVDSVTICASELPYIWMGMEFTAAGMFISEEIVEDENYIYHYIYTLELTVIPFSSDTIVVEAYDSYEWHGKVYTESGTYIYEIYENFCSIEVLELTIIDTPTPPSELQDTIYYADAICEGETYIWWGMEFTETGTYTCTYEEIVEDEDYTYIYRHLHILYLTVLPYETIEYEVEAYDSYEWHGVVYTESGVYTYSDPYNPCVIEELHLTIIETPIIPTEYVTICEGETYIWNVNGLSYYQAGTYTHVIVEDEDYIYRYTLELTVLPSETIEYEMIAYDSYEWHGIVYTESGTYTYQYECTTEVLYLTIIPSEDNQGEVVVEPSTNSVTITWQKEDDADTYIIVIKQGDKVVCTLIFDAEGNLVSVNYLPGRKSNKHGIQHAGLTSDSFQYTITGLTPSTDYTYTVTATDDSDNTISSYSGEFTTHHATSVENTHTQSPTSNCQKIIRNGQLLIFRDGKTYTIMGQEL